jgi:predicted phage replisome organizer
MADVKWIKITTDIFDDEKILMIESMPSADSIIVIWLKLLTFAGKQNNDGVFLMSNRIAYTDEMLACIFRRDVNLVRLALRTFEQFGMIEIVEKVITIPNWNKHQTLDAYDKKKERDRLYQQERRSKQRLLAAGSSDESSDGQATPSSYVAISEEDKEEEKELDIDKERTDYKSLVDLYHSICKSFPSVRSLSDARKKAIKARLNTYSLDDFRTVFENAEASAFLRGSNDRNWSANFDWLIADKNFVKVLEGNYADKPKRGRKEPVPGWMAKERILDNDELAAIHRVMSNDIDDEELKRAEAEQEKELAARAERLKKILRE